MYFRDKLEQAWTTSKTMLCVGLDPIMEKIPGATGDANETIFRFNRQVVDAVGDLVCAFKPQIAHYAAVGAESALLDTVRYIRDQRPNVLVLLDAKRGDIGSTAEMYAREAFVRYGVDAVTVNPFMGDDAVFPFVSNPEHGAIVLCRTSNSDAPRFQSDPADPEPLYARVAVRAQSVWNKHGNVMMVVGATAPNEMASIREIAPDIPFLVPGIGAQGGDLAAVLESGRRRDGAGLVVSSSRAILYAGDATQIRSAAEQASAQLAL